MLLRAFRCLPEAPGRLAAAAVALSIGLLHPAHGAGQTLTGQVMDEVDERPVATALVRLLDQSDATLEITLSDSLGEYSISAPGPGTYRLEAERIGYEPLRTPQLEVTNASGVYAVELAMRPSPLDLPGLTVEAERIPDERISDQIRLMVGLSPKSLRFEPISYDEIQDHLAAARNLADVMRWGSVTGLVVSQTRDGPCFSLRARGCLPVYLNGLQLNRDFMTDIPLDMVHTIVVLTPTDGSIVHPAGAVLLYTAAWLR